MLNIWLAGILNQANRQLLMSIMRKAAIVARLTSHTELSGRTRHPQHVVTAAMMGADIVTLPYSVIKQLANHPLTDAGLKKFMDDAAVMKK